jgi:hypothetical protein
MVAVNQFSEVFVPQDGEESAVGSDRFDLSDLQVSQDSAVAAGVQKTANTVSGCGVDMPSKAVRCPHCGQLAKRIRVRQILFVVGALILLLLLGVGYFMK